MFLFIRNCVPFLLFTRAELLCCGWDEVFGRFFYSCTFENPPRKSPFVSSTLFVLVYSGRKSDEVPVWCRADRGVFFLLFFSLISIKKATVHQTNRAIAISWSTPRSSWSKHNTIWLWVLLNHFYGTFGAMFPPAQNADSGSSIQFLYGTIELVVIKASVWRNVAFLP